MLLFGRVPHLRDGLIVDKVGYFRSRENPDTLTSPTPPELTQFHQNLGLIPNCVAKQMPCA
jgi:hypothetical protein